MALLLRDIQAHPYMFTTALETLYTWALSQEKRYVCTCTVYTLMRALEDQTIHTALVQADMRTADGMPLVWLQHYQGSASSERVYGPDLMLALFSKTSTNDGVSHFFLGGLPGIPEKLADALRARFPGTTIAGIISPQFSETATVPDPEIVERLNQSGATIIWVGLGSPKQDLWMHLYRPFLKAPLLIGVGAAFDFIAGEKAQAPVWMQKRALEWLFRLIQEPSRLWKRYLIYNFRFIRHICSLYLRGQLK